MSCGAAGAPMATRGDAAFARFSAEPELFGAYHRGFRQQTLQWPSNPLDDIIAQVFPLLQQLVTQLLANNVGTLEAADDANTLRAGVPATSLDLA